MATAVQDPKARDSPAFLLARGKIGSAALERAVRLAGDSAERLGTVLLQLGLLSESDLAEAYCAYTNTPRMMAGYRDSLGLRKNPPGNTSAVNAKRVNKRP